MFSTHGGFSLYFFFILTPGISITPDTLLLTLCPLPPPNPQSAIYNPKSLSFLPDV
jgi:hypothetical protein